MNDHLDRLRTKPHHVRRRIAFVTSLGITGFVALGWMGAMATSGSLALATPSITEEETGLSLTETKSNFSELMGAAGAALTASSAPARITVVDGTVSSTLDERRENYNNTDKTVITF